MTKYHGHLLDEARDKPRLDSVKVIVAWIMIHDNFKSDGWWTVPEIYPRAYYCRACKEDTVRRMLNYLMREGTDTHTFHSRESKTRPGTAEYTAKRRENNDDR